MAKYIDKHMIHTDRYKPDERRCCLACAFGDRYMHTCEAFDPAVIMDLSARVDVRRAFDAPLEGFAEEVLREKYGDSDAFAPKDNRYKWPEDRK